MASLLAQLNKKNVSIEKLSDALPANRISEIPISQIDPMPDNDDVFPIDETIITGLMEEIKENGFHIPVTLVKKDDGRYLCIAGHQRIEAMKRLGQERVPADIKQDLTEKQQRDLWRSDNVQRRKFSPLMYAKLIKTYFDDYEQYKPSGKKRDYAANKIGISPSQVPRFYLILNMPQNIQDECADPDFPYTVLGDAAKLSPDALTLFGERFAAWREKHPNLAVTTQDLRQLIKEAERDAQYEDTAVTERKADQSQADAFIEEQYRKYKQALDKKVSGRYAKEKIVTADSVLDSAAENIYAVVASEKYTILNEVSARNAIRTLKEAVKELEKKISYK